MDKDLNEWLIKAENQLIEQEYSNLAFLLESKNSQLKATIIEPFEISHELNIKNLELYCQIREVLALVYVFREDNCIKIFSKKGTESTTKCILVNPGG